ncbi:MAG: alpha/beta hydrolase [Verrucomicrobia bacterium]|nr:alpha/beta hydrolase [Verrucomicrobiota bacterium]
MNDPLDSLQVRVEGRAQRPALVYLPGIHGDWTMITSFRARMRPQVRLVEFSYPRTLTWTLDDYAGAVLAALAARSVDAGWLLGESFGSQVLWRMLEQCGAPAQNPAQAREPGRAGFRPQGVILAGGFVRYPWMGLARLAAHAGRRTPAWGWRLGLRAYALYARCRHRHAPETLADVREFIRRRLEPADRLAIRHRLRLMLENDPRPVARRTRLPVYTLVGALDPVVPALPVRHWLQRHCPGYRGCRTVLPADHNVLGTAPQRSAEQILRWLGIGT